MGVEYRIDTALELLLIRQWGIREPAEMSALFQAFGTDPDFTPGMDSLTDTRQMTGGEFDSAAVMSAALRASMMLAETGRISRQAMLVPCDGPGRDLMQRYASFAGTSPNIQVKLFDTPDAALAWLDRDQADIDDLLGENARWLRVNGQGEDTLS